MTSAHHDAGSSAVLSIMVTIIVAALFHLFKARIPIPFTVLMFLFGMALGGIAYGHVPIGEWITVPEITPKSIFFIFLPVLVFDGSAALKRNVFRNVSKQALLLAGPGILINTAFVAVLLKLGFYESWSWYAAISLAAALSATDPVAVVSLLRDLDADIAVTTLTDGEAILNDGTSIILFSMCIEAAATGSFMPPEEAVWRAILLLLGGFIFGFIWAKMMLFVLSRTNDPLVETMVSVGGSYVAFFLADEVLLTSGVITLGVMGMTIAESKGKRPLIVSEMPQHVWEMLVFVGNAIIFALVGFLIASQAIPAAHGRDWWILIIMYLFLVAARAVMMLMLLPVLNYVAPKDYAITKERFALLVYGALRGGVGLTLALVINRDTRIPLDVRDPALFITGGVVVFSICFNGTTAFKVVSWLRLDVPPPHKLYSQKQTERLMVATLERSVKGILLLPTSREANIATVKAHTISKFTGTQSVTLRHFSDDLTVKPLLLRAMRTELWSLREAELVGSRVFSLLLELCDSAVESGEFLTTNTLLVEAEHRFHRHFADKLLQLCSNPADRRDHVSQYMTSPSTWNEPFFGASPQSFSEGTVTVEDAPNEPDTQYNETAAAQEESFDVHCNVCEALVTYSDLLRGAHNALQTYSSKNRHLYGYERDIEALIIGSKEAFQNFSRMHPGVSSAVVTKRTIQQSLATARKKLHVLHVERGLPRSMYLANIGKIEHLMYETSRMKWHDVTSASMEDVFCSCKLWDPLSDDEKKKLFSLAKVGRVRGNCRVESGGLVVVLSGILSKVTLTRSFHFAMGDYFGLRSLLQHVDFSEYTTDEDVEIAILDEKSLASICAENQKFLVHLWSFVGSRLLNEAVVQFYPYSHAAPEDVEHTVNHGRIFFNKEARSVELHENEALVILHGSDTSGRFCPTSVSTMTGPLSVELGPQSVAYICADVLCNLRLGEDRCRIPFLDEANQLMNRIIESLRSMLNEDIAPKSQMPLLLEYIVSFAAGTLRIFDDSISETIPKQVKDQLEAELREFCHTIQTWSTEEQLGMLRYSRVLEALEKWASETGRRLSWVETLFNSTNDTCRSIFQSLHHHHQFINEREERLFWERMGFMHVTTMTGEEKSVRRQRSMRVRKNGASGALLKKNNLQEFHFPKPSAGEDINCSLGRTLTELTRTSVFGPTLLSPESPSTESPPVDREDVFFPTTVAEEYELQRTDTRPPLSGLHTPVALESQEVIISEEITEP